jgi:protein-S-isoprenylcysteine O-methyltransferase Ste14
VFLRRLTLTLAVLWAIIEIFINIKQSRSARVKSRKDRGSLIFIYATITAGFYLGVPLSSGSRGRIAFAYPFLEVCGLALMAAGFAVRLHAAWALKGQFTHFVTVQAEDKLVQTGLCRSIRHPAYAGELVTLFGIGLALGNWLTILALFGIPLLGFLYRISVEEKTLLAHYGEEYRQYCERTKRLVPGIY